MRSQTPSTGTAIAIAISRSRGGAADASATTSAPTTPRDSATSSQLRRWPPITGSPGQRARLVVPGRAKYSAPPNGGT